MRKILTLTSIIIVLLVICTSGCSYLISESRSSETGAESVQKPEFTSSVTLEPDYTKTPTYSQTIIATASLRPEDPIIPTPRPAERSYVDPEGWFSVIFPGDYEPTESENRFTEGSSYLEFGFLSELSHVAGINTVCAWLANIISEDPQNWVVDWSLGGENCSARTAAGVSRQIRYDVFYHPSADPAHRYAYVKSAQFNCPVKTQFSWLIPKDQKYIQELPPIDSNLLSEWEKTAPILEGVTIWEYSLAEGSNPYREMLVNSLPEEAKPYWARDSYTPSTPQRTVAPPSENILESLGYELTHPNGINNYGQLLRDGRVLFDPVYTTVSHKFETDSGTITAIEVVPEYGKNRAYLVLNDVIHPWLHSGQDPGFPPIIYQDELLWIQASEDWEHVQIVTSYSEIISSFAVYTEPMYSTKNYLKWGDQWIWVLRDFVIIDGEILNESLGFQEIFLWRLINGKPAYFFRKDGRVGFSFDGRIYPLEYQHIAHYMCCGYSINNPSLYEDSAHFFAEREGVWYYVVLEFK